jgi:two-component system sensor kinase
MGRSGNTTCETTPEGGAAVAEEARVFHDRYRVLRPLKKANGVETLLGRDLIDNELVVIKVASSESLSSAARVRLEHEAQVLREIRSPWFAPLLHLGREDDLLYMVLPFLAGVSLEERLRRGPLSVADTLTVGRCLMTALQEAHGHGVLHRDLKPGNVIVDEGDPLRRATIIDFGLARSGRLDASLRDQPVGTARYMAPEQAGLLDHPVDERSDLYSAGVVLFECLAGEVPFRGENVGDVLRQHLTARPPELRSLGVRVPRALDEVVQRLLRKDPRDRYQSAGAVLADLAAIAAARDGGVSDPAIVVGLCDRRQTLTEPAFVGRAEQLAALDAQLRKAAEGQGGLILLEAESGGGKTRLLAELAQRGARQGFRVLRGRALDQVAQRPFEALSGVLETLTPALADPGLARALREHLGEHLDAACAALPELAEALGARPSAALGPETFGQARSLEALATLFDALGGAGRPALVLLDDCQWADELTLKLVGHWERRRAAAGAGRHLLLVVTYRSEEMSAAQVLRGAQPALHLKLPAFGPEDVRLLAESMAGPLPAEALDVVRRFCEGSPFMAAAVLQGMVESGALAVGPSGWQIDPLAMADVQASRHSAAFLARRMELLPAQALALLSVGAVLGKEFDLALAAELAGQETGEALATVDDARRRHIVWVNAADGRCAFLHDKLRRTLLDRLPAAERNDLHLRAALRLERQPAPCVFSLAYHFDAAGDSRRALPHALAAAAQARAQHSLEIAAQQYRIAERGAHWADDKTRYRIAEGLSDVLMLQGRYDEAGAQLERARRLAHDAVVRARVERRLGELAFKRGDMETAIGCLEQGLRFLGRRVPRWRVTFLLLLAWELIVQVLHTYLPGLFLGRRRLGGAEAELQAVRIYSRLAYAYWFARGRVPCLWVGMRELNRAERYPPTPELAQAYSEQAPGMTLLSLYGRGIACAEKSLVIRRDLGDVWGQGQSLHFYGVVLYAAGRFAEAIDKCREAVRLLRRTGDYWEVNIARYQIAASLYRLGDLRGGLDEARTMYQSGLELGDGQATGISLDVWAWASGGKVPAEVIQAELARPSNDVQRTAQVLMAEAMRLLGEGRPAEAATVLEQARRRARAAGVRNAWVAPLHPWLATALRRQTEALTDRTPRRRRRLLARLRAAVLRALRTARSFPNERPHALREAALLAALEGRCGRSRRLFEDGLAVAERQGARYERALTLLARGQVGLEAGWPGADADVAEGEKLRAALEVPVGGTDKAAAPAVTLSLADRFENVLDAGRRIASALTREAIAAAVQDAGLRLLRGEHCVVLDVSQVREGEEATVSSSQIKGEYSRAMVRRALASRRAVAFVEGVPDSPSESLLLSGARSSLCAPVFVRGRPVGCFYVSHRQVARLFGEDEERLADFIATLAGAALENAENFAELRRLNESLELRIAERRKAEKQIQEQAALLDKAQDAICVVDFQDRILYWNQSAERLYGWAAAEAVGKTATELLFRGASPQLAEALRTVLDHGEWTGEMQQVTRAGEKITVESRWTLVCDDEGRPKSRLVVNTNITEKKKIEARFLRAQRMESIGTLAGGIAHDLNNMLAPILMAVDLFRLPIPESERPALLATIRTSAERGAEMVRQILSFARGVEGQRVVVQLKHLVRDLEKVLRSTLPKSIAVDVALPRELWVVQGDATQLYQVLMNLCVNARDAMPEGGRLTIGAEHAVLDEGGARMHPDARPGRFVALKITDTGSGIPPEILDRIFDPFFTTKEVGKGTGLGLSTVLGIVKSHGGFVHVASEVGKGTQFAVYLPAAEVPGVRHDEGKPQAPRRGRGELILVVDDEAAVRAVMTAALEAHGFRVKVAREGTEALALYAQHRAEVRLVVTDMMMPVMDGLATIRALRQMDPDVRILATSGLADAPPRIPGSAVQGFLAKPYTAEDLVGAVCEVLEGAVPAGTARVPAPEANGHPATAP